VIGKKKHVINSSRFLLNIKFLRNTIDQWTTESCSPPPQTKISEWYMNIIGERAFPLPAKYVTVTYTFRWRLCEGGGEERQSFLFRAIGDSNSAEKMRWTINQNSR
jgi:hypothetical protein